MNRLILLLMLCATLLPSLALADETFGLRYEIPASGTGERLLILPQDENKMYFSVIGDPSDGQYQRVAGWFDSHPKLKALKAKVHFHLIGTNSTMFKERFAKTTPGTPLVRLQAANGVILYQKVGEKVPASADILFAEIDAECFRRWNQNNCPRPSPQPSPSPSPSPSPQPEPSPSPVSELPPWWLMLLSFVVGAGIGVAVQYKNTYYAEA